MIVSIDLPPFLGNLHREALDAAARCFDRLEPDLVPAKVPPGTDLFELLDDGYAFIREGWFKFERGGRMLRVYSAGEIVHSRRGAHPDGATMKSEFEGDVATIRKGLLVELLQTDPALSLDWFLWQETEMRILQDLCTLFMSEEVRPEFVIRRFRAGDTVLRQGETPDAIYVLLEGAAAAFLDGAEVGRIGAGEPFGEISFLTEQPRVASVVATEDGVAQRIGRDDFLALLRTKPRFIAELAKALAGRVIRLNDRVAGRAIV